MRKKIIALAFTGFLLLALAALPVAAQELTGAIRGVVKDATGAVIPGADVTLTGSGVELSTTSDGTGAFSFRNLASGTYTVQVTSTGFKTTTISSVAVVVGRTTSADANMEVGQVADTVEVTASAVIIDTASSKSIVNITEDIMDALPKGRGFTSMIQLAPGARKEPLQGGGFQLDGASAGENTFAIEGQDTTAIRTGLSTIDPPTDFFQEVTVKSSGFEAEHGGALGGVINAVVKRGGTDWHGSVLMYYRNDDLDAAPRGLLRLDPSATFDSAARLSEPLEVLDNRRDDYRIIEPGFEAGGPIGTEKLTGFFSYIPRINTNNRVVQVPGQGPTSFTRGDNTHFTIGRLDYNPVDAVRINGSWNYAYRRTRGTARPNRDGIEGEFNSSATTIFRADRGQALPSVTWAIGGDWTPTSNFTLTTRYGLWHADTQDRGLPSGIRYGNVTSGIDCSPTPCTSVVSLDGTTVAPQFQFANGFRSIGANFGTLFDDFERNSLGADGAYFFNAFGTHSLKGGFAWNNISNDIKQSYDTAFVLLAWGDFFGPTTVDETALCAPVQAANLANFGIPLAQGCRGNFGYWWIQDFARGGLGESDNYGLYIQDSWTVGGGVTLNLGVRLDQEYLPSFTQGANIVSRPIEFGFGDKIAPRLGAAWDVKQDGTFKIFGSWGQFFDIMKFEMPRGLFGGAYWHNCTYTLDTDNFLSIVPIIQASSGRVCNNGAQGSIPGTFLGEEDFRIPANTVGNLDNVIDPDLKPMRQYELTIGSEYALTNDMGIEVRYSRKRLHRTIEDVGILTAAGEVFLITNPGEGIATAPLADDCAACSTLPNMPKPVREYDGLEFRFNKRYTDNWFMTASYTWSKLFGNYSGLTSTDEAGRASPNVNRFFDEQTMLFDANGQPAMGNLPTDRPHTVKLFYGYQLNWFGQSTLISANQLIYSGSALSSDVNFLGGAPSFFWGRGNLADITRNPANGDFILNGVEIGARTEGFSETDFNIRQEFKLSQTNEKVRLSVEFNLLNAFNQRNATRIYDNVLRTSQLVFSFGTDANNDCLNTTSTSCVDFPKFFAGFDPIVEMNAAGLSLDSRYGLERTHQAPRTIRLKFAVTF